MIALFATMTFAVAPAEARERLEATISCDGCPTFVRVPDSDTTAITHVAKYELTWNQYLAAFDSGVCPLPPLFDRNFRLLRIERDDPLLAELRRDYAVINLRPSDVQCYIQWLSARLGKSVRLPAYREWEWFARSGVPTRRFPWGDEEDPTREALVSELVLEVLSQSHVDRVKDVRLAHIMWGTQVGLFPPTEWGLYDVLGNVPELTSDVIDQSNVEKYRDELGIPISLSRDRSRIIKGQNLSRFPSDAWREGISKTSHVSEADNAFSFPVGVRLVLE
ncbi:SUMF1/EgtB/PvdO family nonheme iron enzyme [Porphyrobacter sp. TH134]|uniref:SUMF1/EgtB/PvdO family nonheme iron enzyme n=1 Tax=Porphyrobacter sp. TH134 TaxID=2067450 RepID=UPI001552BFC0|nr:SUMF1/EgtB/PvdO family nonheme iron enzyme [Porphyrobacter sp. TH134]